MSRVESNENSVRQSNLEMQMVSAAAPPTEDKESASEEQETKEEQPMFEDAKVEVTSQQEQLSTPTKAISKKQSSNQTQSEQQQQRNQTQASVMSFENKAEDKAAEDDDFQSHNNISGLRKPTEYSASVDHLPKTQRDDEKEGYLMGEVVIKSPVQFEMMPESDVKVNETNSSQVNLLIQDRIAFDDDNNLNDQIISPSEGIQVPNGEFYQIQREIRSSQVHKKSQMAIAVIENEIESEKLESPKPLGDDNNFDGSPYIQDKRLCLPGDEEGDLELE